MSLTLPRLPRGRPSLSARTFYDQELRGFCDLILEIKSTLDFQVSSRGWCYILEEHGLSKGSFDEAQALIAECRKQRLLPMDIVAEDGARAFDNLEHLDTDDAADFAEAIVGSIRYQHEYYTPISFWEDHDVYLEMLVEKTDLKSLFGSICAAYCIPIANARGWSDLNTRWAMLERIRAHAAAGRRCVILYCGDHDPAGLYISDSLRKNLADLLSHAEWLDIMGHLEIDRFGLNSDFIEHHNLSWIDNLDTGSSRSLADPRHKDHKSNYVQRYPREFGPRKVEANALVVRPQAGRDLCRETIMKYLPEGAISRYREALAPHRESVRAEVLRRIQFAYGERGGAV